jgi:hypothetical protein
MSGVVAETLWTVYRQGREATALVRNFSFGRQLRVMVGGEPVFTRLLRDDDAQAVGSLSAETLKAFVQAGWRESPET